MNKNTIMTVMAVLLTVVVGATVGAVATDSQDYEVTSTLDNPNTTNASAINVSVNGSVVGNLTNADHNDIYANHTNITYEYVDSSGNVTASHIHEVGTGNATFSLNDANVSVTESEYTSSGTGGSSSGTSMALIGAILAGAYLLLKD